MKRFAAALLCVIFCLALLCGCNGNKNTINTTEKAILSDLYNELSDTLPADIYGDALSRAAAILADAASTSAQITDITTELLRLRDEYLNKNIAFADSAAEKAIKRAMKKGETEFITVAEARTVTELDLTFTDQTVQLAIVQTADFSYFCNLKKLSLANNEIADITGLSTLSRLTELDLSQNKITDISPLSGLTALKTLNVSQNQIADITAVKNLLLQLTYLDISSNAITSFEPLREAKNLASLSLDGYTLGSIEFLYGLEKLQTLTMKNCVVEGGVELKNLIYISSLDISGTTGVSNSDLAALTGLKKLTACGCGIFDASFLSGMVNLTHLDLSQNSLALFDYPATAKGLISVKLSHNGLSSVFLPSGLPLRELDLSQNALTEAVVGIQPELKTLLLSQNMLSWLDILSLSSLETLDLSQNSVADTSFISSQTLKTLDLSHNSVSELNIFTPSLTMLSVSQNPLVSIVPISALTSLTSLDITGVTAFASLEFLRPLTLLQKLKADCVHAETRTIPDTLTQLEMLEISGADDLTLSSLAIFTRLKSLSLYSPIFSSPQISGFKLLQSLKITGTAFSDISGINTLENLENLYISDANLGTVTLAPLPALKSLTLTSCAVTALSGLEQLPSLTRLILPKNTPQSFSFIALPKLEYLDLSACGISYISDFSLSTTACSINLSQNNLTDLSGLVAIKRINILDISQNPITDYSALDGITVSKVIK